MGKGLAPSEVDPEPTRRSQSVCAAGYVPADPVAFTAASTAAKAKIKKVVILMLENRSFDHYLSQINKYKVKPGARVPTGALKSPTEPKHSAVVASAGWAVEGIPHHKAPLPCTTALSHEWWAIHRGWNNGRMDQFVSTTQFYTNEGQPNPMANELALRNVESRFLKKSIATFSQVLRNNRATLQGVADAFDALATHPAVVKATEVFGTIINNNFTRLGLGKTAADLPISAYIMSGAPAMQYFDWEELPFYYELAATFPIGDKYFSPVLGPTFINRNYLYGATSRSMTYNNTAAGSGAADAAVNEDENKGSLPEALEMKGISHRFFVSSHTSRGVANPYRYGSWIGLKDRFRAIVGKSHKDFFDLAKAGNLPQVSFVDADIAENAAGEDEHPPGNVQIGQHLAWEIVRAVMTSPSWNETALFITYDGNGGFADSVPPTDACEPGSSNQTFGGFYAGADQAASKKFRDDFDRFGIRVPLYVVSPFAKAGGYVSKNVYDHTSIVRFIEMLHNMEPLTSRDKAADPMLDFFDFTANGSRGAFATIPPGAFQHSYADEDDVSGTKPSVPFVPYRKRHQIPVFSRGPYTPVVAAPHANPSFAPNPFPEPTVDIIKYLLCQALFSSQAKFTQSWPTNETAATMINPLP